MPRLLVICVGGVARSNEDLRGRSAVVLNSVIWSSVQIGDDPVRNSYVSREGILQILS